MNEPFALMLLTPHTQFTAPISLVFTRPDGTTYFVSGSVYVYTATINFEPCVVYNVAVNELAQAGWWLVYFQMGVYASTQYQFYLDSVPL